MPNDAIAAPAVAMPPVSTFTPRDEFELALRQAKVYAASTIVPDQYRDNLPNCLIALNMAKRIGSDPMQTMQSLYIVHGRPAWSAQFLIATFNRCGKFSALRYEVRGDDPVKKDYAMRAYATELATGEKIYGPWIDWKMVGAEAWDKKSGSKWQSIPSLMFQYRSAAWLIRTHAPELAMGLQTAEEVADVIDVTPTAQEIVRPSVERAKDQVRGALAASESSTPPIAYAEVAEALNKAHDGDTFNDAADLIRSVGDEKQREELTALARERRAAILGEDVAQ